MNLFSLHLLFYAFSYCIIHYLPFLIDYFRLNVWKKPMMTLNEKLWKWRTINRFILFKLPLHNLLKFLQGELDELREKEENLRSEVDSLDLENKKLLEEVHIFFLTLKYCYFRYQTLIILVHYGIKRE